MAKFACARPSTFNGAIMRIAIYGLGYVGLTGAICLASEGHHLFGVDVSDDKVRRIMAGSSPIKEPGLDFRV